MLKWLPIGSCMLCGYTASWGDARWTNGSQAFQVRLCQVGHLAFSAGQHVHGPMVLEAWNGHSGAKPETGMGLRVFLPTM